MAQKHKGFAYTQSSDKYKVVYGDTEKEILDKLNGWNRARVDDMKYVYCNIGAYNPETEKYVRYQKFDVATGRNISPLELKIPSVSKEEFGRIIKEFKEQGAKYNYSYKKWYVSPDNENMAYFQKYLDKQLPSHEKRQAEADAKRNEEKAAAKPEDDKETLREQRTANKQEYAPELVAQAQKIAKADLQEMDIAQEKLSLLQELVEKDMEINGKVSDMTNYLLDAYHAEIQSQDSNGKMWVAYKQQEQSVQDVVASAKRTQKDNSALEYQEGDRIDVYRAKMIANPEAPDKILISGISPVNGIVEEVSYDPADEPVYRVREDDTLITHVNQSEIYSKLQADVLLRAVDDKLPPEKFDVVAQPKFNNAQMEELRMAFKEGLSIEQVEQFADPALESWKMDLCKYGMQHGLEMSVLQKLYRLPNKDWFECRREVNGIISDRRKVRIMELEKQGFTANSKIINSMERLDCLTKHTNSLKDICNAFKEGTFKGGEARNIVNDLGRKFQQQELQHQMMESLVPEPSMAEP